MICCLYLPFQAVFCQAILGIEPEAGVSFPVSSYTKAYSKIAARWIPGESVDDRRLDRLEWEAALSYNGFLGIKLGVGYLFRKYMPLEDVSVNEHRVFGQLGYNQYLGAIALFHRIKIEQRYRKTGDAFRLRYRVATEFPFVGNKLDTGEPYLLTSLEALAQVSDGTWEEEVRAVVGLGWLVNEKHTLEAVLEYRIDGFFGTAQGGQLILIGAGYYLQF